MKITPISGINFAFQEKKFRTYLDVDHPGHGCITNLVFDESEEEQKQVVDEPDDSKVMAMDKEEKNKEYEEKNHEKED